jgi:hypothetical protein
MPRAWSTKDERMYEHVVESELARGRSRARAREIAARTVNRQRHREGRTLGGKRATSGTGNPSLGLEERTKDQLLNRARQLRVGGRSRMTKRDLVSAIRDRS